VLPYRSNIPKIAMFAFERIDDGYAKRALDSVQRGHAIIGGRNYGQGSSREHAALGPRFLGLRVVIAKSMARIHRQNLANFGVLALTFEDPDDYDRLYANDLLKISNVHWQLQRGGPIEIESIMEGGRASRVIRALHTLTERQVKFVLMGGLINWMKERLSGVAI
jgi:aconitate hydratase